MPKILKIKHSCYIHKKEVSSNKLIAMITKTKVKETLEKFPEEFSIDDLVEKLIIIDKVERARQQSRNGEVITEEELDADIEKWFE